MLKFSIIFALIIFIFLYKKKTIINNVVDKKIISVLVVKNSTNKGVVIGYGDFSYQAAVNIFSEVSSDVDKIFINGHKAVKKGEIIMKLKERNIVDNFEFNESSYESLFAKYNSSKTMFQKGLISEIEFLEAKSAYENASANMKKSKFAKDGLTVKAPFDGTIIDMFVGEGTFINGKDSPFPTTLYKIVKHGKGLITVRISNRFLNKFKIGQYVDVTCGDKNIHNGKILRFENTSDVSTGYFSIVVDPDNDLFNLGDSCKLNMNYDVYHSFGIPNEILSIENGKSGLVVISDSVVVFREVEVLNDGFDRMLVAGLKDGDMVIVSGRNYIKIGEKIDDRFIINISNKNE